jgi:hypothetical protein
MQHSRTIAVGVLLAVALLVGCHRGPKFDRIPPAADLARVEYAPLERRRIRAGKHRYSLAWGHGGQHVAINHELELVVVITTYPMVFDHGGRWWRRERDNLNLVADFIAARPKP